MCNVQVGSDSDTADQISEIAARSNTARKWPTYLDLRPCWILGRTPDFEPDTVEQVGLVVPRRALNAEDLVVE
jgi:hypothetical protein